MTDNNFEIGLKQLATWMYMATTPQWVRCGPLWFVAVISHTDVRVPNNFLFPH